MNQLAKHLKSSDLSDDAFAAASGIERSLVNRYRRGKVRPSFAKAAIIERVTNGAVPASCWYPELGSVA